MIRKFLSRINVLQALGLLLVMIMFLPRLVKKGMFGDGLLYASMARNMAEGRGSFWKPYFSESYWLENMPTTYYENPPLMLWLESLLFSICGDHWWVEKFFCLIVLTVNIYLMTALWKIIFHDQDELKKYAFLPVVFWYMIPVVVWGNVNNLMDNVLYSFCLAAIIFIYKAIESSKYSIFWLILSSMMIFLGILSKGPVAMYALALPGIIFITERKIGFSKAILFTFGLTIFVIGIFGVLLAFSENAQEFFNIYWKQRLLAVIEGSRGDMKLSGASRFYILGQLMLELAPTLGISALSLVVIKLCKLEIRSWNTHQKKMLTFLLIGFAATLPILVSTKQSGIYLIPGIPMFSFAAALFFQPILASLAQTNFFQKWKLRITQFSFIGIVILLVFTISIFGDKRREADLITDIEYFITIIPEGSQFGVCEEVMKDFVVHTYMQRMGKYSLGSNYCCAYQLINDSCTEVEKKDLGQESYKLKSDEEGKFFTLYKR